jgi:O-methyltransferase
MPQLAKSIGPLSIIRFDGDMYESAVDVFYNLYDKLSVGGYVIMDDWYGFQSSEQAALDFFAVHKFEPEIVRIDDWSAYWKKTSQVEIQRWRYAQSKFTL